jgi:hypothetical protein
LVFGIRAEKSCLSLQPRLVPFPGNAGQPNRLQGPRSPLVRSNLFTGWNGEVRPVQLVKNIDNQICSWIKQKHSFTPSLMNEKTPFLKAFPELAGLPEKMDEVHDKVLTGEMSVKEAEAILKEARKDQQNALKKMKMLRRMPWN